MDSTNPSAAALAKQAEAEAEARAAAEHGEHPPAFADALNDSDGLPSYSPAKNHPPRNGSSSTGSPYRSDHEYTLTTSKGKVWLALKLKSRAPPAAARNNGAGPARDAHVSPLFVDEDEISGTVEVDLDKAESWKSITIEVRI